MKLIGRQHLGTDEVPMFANAYDGLHLGLLRTLEHLALVLQSRWAISGGVQEHILPSCPFLLVVLLEGRRLLNVWYIARQFIVSVPVDLQRVALALAWAV